MLDFLTTLSKNDMAELFTESLEVIDESYAKIETISEHIDDCPQDIQELLIYFSNILEEDIANMFEIVKNITELDKRFVN